MQLFILFTAAVLFLIYASIFIFYGIAWRSIPGAPPAADKVPVTHISVIIPARNEAVNIAACVESVLRQSYPAQLFEIIVVDDHSTDNTAEIVLAMSVVNLKLLPLKDYTGSKLLNSYKKKAIETGIAQSKGTLIVTTDADCLVPEHWLKTIAAFYETHQPAFVAAPVAINWSSRFIEIFQALDFMTLQGITGASVHKNIHSMCNGANLAYEKAAFYEVGGFKDIDHIASGDDMLLMHKIYKRYPTRTLFLKSREAIVLTAPQNSTRSFFNQRIRWASKADKYDDKRMFPVLLLVYLFNAGLLLLFLLAIFSNQYYVFFDHSFSLLEGSVCLLILKTIVEVCFLFPVATFFNKRSLLVVFPLLQPFHIIYIVVAGWLGKFGAYAWKGRTVK